MLKQLGAQGVALNRVRALELAQDLTREYSKQVWREATANALARWRAAGNRPTICPPSARGNHKRSWSYRED